MGRYEDVARAVRRVDESESVAMTLEAGHDGARPRRRLLPLGLRPFLRCGGADAERPPAGRRTARSVSGGPPARPRLLGWIEGQPAFLVQEKDPVPDQHPEQLPQ